MNPENMTLKALRSQCALYLPRGNRSQVAYWDKDKAIAFLKTRVGEPEEQKTKQETVTEETEEEQKKPTESKKSTSETQKTVKVTDNTVIETLAAALNGKLSAGLDENRVKQLINEQIKSALLPTVVTVENKKTGTSKNVGLTHERFEDIVKLVNDRLDLFLVGAAGSGKTTVCEQVAEALDLPFYFIPVGLQTTKSDLLGYMNATGDYVKTHLRQAYEHGGVFLLDEIDAGNPNVLTVINAMLANCKASFPDKMIDRHEDFIFIGAGNTYGLGNDRQYVGRNQLDAATLDRFVVLNFDYDKKLEKALSNNDVWLNIVWDIRKAVEKLGEKLIVSPRAIIKGDKMLASGFSIEQVKDALIYRGINKEIKTRIEHSVGV